MRGGSSRTSTWAALGLVLIWLFLAGSLTWQRSRESVVPPVWDQQTYVQKGEAMWSDLSKQPWQNPLNIEPSSRPPGTVLLTAPLGPLNDVRDFYFRSAFVPVAIMVFAVFLTGVGVTRWAWPSAFVALLAGSMPMFWQFEIGKYQTSYNWGLVDTFLASLAALAMAGLFVSAVRFKRVGLGVALVALALLPLVKPTGFVLGGLISLAWLALAMRFAGNHPRGRAHGRIRLIATAIAILLVLGGLALASFNSDYFSPSNIAFGKVALQQLKSEWFKTDPLASFISLFTGSIGTPLLVCFVTLGGMAILRRKKTINITFANEARWAAGIGILVCLVGILLTYQATLFRQTRYFFPVIAVVTILFTPTLVAWTKRAGPVLCSAIAVLPIALLVFLTSPRLTGMAYRLGGYGLFTGFGRNELRTATVFINQYRQTHPTPPILFSTSDGITTAAFEAAFTNRLRQIGYPDAQINPLVSRPYNWESGGLVKIESIYNADILALEGVPRPQSIAPQANPQTATPLLTFSDELAAWKEWLATTPSKGSTKVLLESPGFVVLEVKDRSALETQMRTFIASRQWRPEFILTNTRSKFTAAEVSGLRLTGQLLTQPVDFGTAIRVHALALARDSGGANVDVAIYSERLAGDANQTFSLFIHQLDSKGNMISSHDVYLGSSRVSDRPVSLEKYSFHLLPETRQLGVGVYAPGDAILITDWPLAKDWDGRRAKLDLTSLPVVTSKGQKQ